LYDLQLAREAFLPLDKPMGVVINRAGVGDDDVYGFCRSVHLPIWTEIPYDRQIAAAYSQSRIVADVSAHLKAGFMELADKIRQAAGVTGEVCLA
jgi:MinD superfamily P-loop ATPase